jgi:transposase
MPSKKSPRKHTAQFKMKLALEAIETDDLPGVSRKYNVAHSLLAKWKRRIIEDGHHVFETTPDKEKEKMHKQIGKLEQMVGKKEVELNLLKNFSDFYASENGP